MEYILLAAAGAVVGSIITVIVYSIRTTTGTLRIDHTNPEKDIFRFDIDDLDILTRKKRIVLKIDHDAVLSQY